MALPVLLFATSAAHADPVRYGIAGSNSATLWAMGDRPGTEVIAYVFQKATPEQGEAPKAEPRMIFSATEWQWSFTGFLRRHWYGDAALPAEAFTIGEGMKDGKLSIELKGTMEERSLTGVVVKRDVPGKLEVTWTAGGDPASSTISYSYQSPGYSTQLQMVGEARTATVAGKLSVEGWGEPLNLWGFGSLCAVSSGTLSVTLQ
jgi:hypothetical protein